MATDMKTQASALRRNIGYYPLCSLLETATIAIAKTLVARRESAFIERYIVINYMTEEPEFKGYFDY
jgi:hypothetical protein